MTMNVMQLFLLVVSLTAVSFGGGNMLLAGLERELVHTGVITPAEFASGVALGQATPGPLAAFTTAIGKSVLGVPGAIAATLALVVVSLAAVLLISRVPFRWFQRPAVKGGLTAISPYAVALVLFLAYRIILAGNHAGWIAPVSIMALVLAGRLLKVPTALLIIGGVGIGMLLQGSAFAGW